MHFIYTLALYYRGRLNNTVSIYHGLKFDVSRGTGVQMERLIKEQEIREIRNHERASVTDDELRAAQEIIDVR